MRVMVILLVFTPGDDHWKEIIIEVEERGDENHSCGILPNYG